MKIVKRVFIGLAIVIAIPLVVAFFVKQKYDVERQITIDKPNQEVFDYIKHLKNQDNYSKWSNMDPNMRKTFTGVDATVGFVSARDSDNKDVGKGEQEILKITEGERVDFELRFLEPFESTEKAYMTTESVSGNKTLVEWGFNGKIKYPMNLIFLFIDFDAMLGDDLQTGLDNLKTVLEKS